MPNKIRIKKEKITGGSGGQAEIIHEQGGRHEPMRAKLSARSLSFIVIVSFVFGLVGGGLVDRVIIPLVKSRLDKSGTVVIPEKTENIRVEENSATTDAVSKIKPAVVSILATKDVQSFFGETMQEQSGGTGFIITKDGLILTNKHVAGDSKADYTVFTNDGKDYPAKVLSTDPLNDLAVIKIEANNLPVVELGDSDELKVGQTVVAIGNALGQYENSVTKGVVSGVGRSITAGSSFEASQDRIEGVIQTDAAINPGNSGGPLIDISGRVVGINTAIDQGGQSIGFAIPVNIAKPAIDSIIDTGKIVRPMLGVSYITITKEFAAANNLKVDEGAYIYGRGSQSGVLRNGPADEAGLEDEDVITEVGGEKVTRSKTLSILLQKYKPGDEVEIKYLRKGDEKITKAKLTELEN